MKYEDAKCRYESDPEFRRLVDLMVGSIERLEFTPGDLKQAAVFAEIRFENSRIRAQKISRQAMEDGDAE